MYRGNVAQAVCVCGDAEFVRRLQQEGPVTDKLVTGPSDAHVHTVITGE